MEQIDLTPEQEEALERAADARAARKATEAAAKPSVQPPPPKQPAAPKS